MCLLVFRWVFTYQFDIRFGIVVLVYLVFHDVLSVVGVQDISSTCRMCIEASYRRIYHLEVVFGAQTSFDHVFLETSRCTVLQM